MPKGVSFEMTLDIFPNPISFDLLYKESLDVYVSSKDDLSGIDSYYYYVDNSGSETVKKADELNRCTFTKVKATDSNPIKVTSLGGLDESGKNCLVIEVDNDAYIIECGLKYPMKNILKNKNMCMLYLLIAFL